MSTITDFFSSHMHHCTLIVQIDSQYYYVSIMHYTESLSEPDSKQDSMPKAIYNKPEACMILLLSPSYSDPLASSQDFLEHLFAAVLSALGVVFIVPRCSIFDICRSYRLSSLFHECAKSKKQLWKWQAPDGTRVDQL